MSVTFDITPISPKHN